MSSKVRYQQLRINSCLSVIRVQSVGYMRAAFDLASLPLTRFGLSNFDHPPSFSNRANIKTELCNSIGSRENWGQDTPSTIAIGVRSMHWRTTSRWTTGCAPMLATGSNGILRLRRCCSPAFNASDGSEFVMSSHVPRPGALSLPDAHGVALQSVAGSAIRPIIETPPQDIRCSRVCHVGMQFYVHRVTAQPTTQMRISVIPTSVPRRFPRKTSPAPAVFFLPHTILLRLRPKPIQ